MGIDKLVEILDMVRHADLLYLNECLYVVACGRSIDVNGSWKRELRRDFYSISLKHEHDVDEYIEMQLNEYDRVIDEMSPGSNAAFTIYSDDE